LNSRPAARVLSETVNHQSLSGQPHRMADDLDADILADAGPDALRSGHRRAFSDRC
jgi:hypothetical protein